MSASRFGTMSDTELDQLLDGLVPLVNMGDPDDYVSGDERTTGTYDARFLSAAPLVSFAPAQRLEDARVGLDLFLSEVGQALRMGDMTDDQRAHLSLISSYIEGLLARFDIVRQPGFVQAKPDLR